MSRIPLLIAVVVSLTLLACGSTELASDMPKSPVGAPSSLQLDFTGLSLKKFASDGSGLSMRTRRVRWRKRSFGVFSVAFLREIVVDEGRIRIDLSTGPCGAPITEACALDSTWREAILMVSKFGNSANRITIKPFLLEVVDGTRRRFEIRSGAARSDAAGHTSLVGGVRVLASNGRELRSRRASLSNGTWLSVRGGYSLFDDTGARLETGTDAVFRLNASGGLQRYARASEPAGSAVPLASPAM